MISLTNIEYKFLTPKVIGGHLGSLEVKKRSNLKNVPRDTIFGIHTHMIPLTIIGYDVLTPIVIRGHLRSLEVKTRSNLKKNTQGYNYWHTYSYDTPDHHDLWYFDPNSH